MKRLIFIFPLFFYSLCFGQKVIPSSSEKKASLLLGEWVNKTEITKATIIFNANGTAKMMVSDLDSADKKIIGAESGMGKWSINGDSILFFDIVEIKKPTNGETNKIYAKFFMKSKSKILITEKELILYTLVEGERLKIVYSRQ